MGLRLRKTVGRGTIGNVYSQAIVILELSEPKSLSVKSAQRIADKLIGTKGPKGEVVLQRSIDGEVTPGVAFQLTESGAVFTLSGTSGRVYAKLWELCPDDFGPGTRIAVDNSNTLVIKSCGEFPQPKPSKTASQDASSSDGAFNQVLDAAVKLASLAVQTSPSS